MHVDPASALAVGWRYLLQNAAWVQNQIEPAGIQILWSSPARL
jgi:hypothetical protein